MAHSSNQRKPIRLLVIIMGTSCTLLRFMHGTINTGVDYVTAANLDKRGIGDVWTMTVEEYRRFFETGPAHLPVFPKSIYYVHRRAGFYDLHQKQVHKEKHVKTGKIQEL